MKHLIFLAMLLLTSNAIIAQPNIEWQKSLGGTSSDQARSIQQTTDGGYIVAGCTSSNNEDVSNNHGNGDYWIVKLGSMGNLQWQKSFGGSLWDEANSIQQTTDGGYIVAGYSHSNDGDVTNNHGNGDGDGWIIKIGSTGNLQWQKTLGGSAIDRASSIQQTTDGGYIVAGYTESNNGDITNNHGLSDYWVVKLNDSGVIQWQKTLGGAAIDRASSIQQTTDGGYIVAGWSESTNGDIAGNHGSCDYWVVKLNDSGIIQWQKSLGGAAIDRASSIQQTTDGGYIVCGYSYSSNGNVTTNYGEADYWVVKLNDSGVIQWQKTLGGTAADMATAIQQTTDNGYIIAGSSISANGDRTEHFGDLDYWVVKLDSTSTIQWQKSLGIAQGEGAYAIKQTTDGGYIVAGESSGTHGLLDYWVVKLDNTTVGLSQVLTQENLFSIYPNPTTQQLHAKVDVSLLGTTYRIYDGMGKTALTGNITTENTIIELGNLSGGVYIFSIGDKGLYQQKFVKH